MNYAQNTLGLCTRGRRWEIGRCGFISAAEDGGCEGVAETMVLFDHWFRAKGWAKVGLQENALKYVESSAHTVVGYPRHREE